MTANHHITIALANERIADLRHAAAADRAAAATSNAPSAPPADMAPSDAENDRSYR